MPNLKLVYDFRVLPSFIRTIIIHDRPRGLWYHYIHDKIKPMSEYKGGDILKTYPNWVGDGEEWITERGDDPVSDWFYDQNPDAQEVYVEINW